MAPMLAVRQYNSVNEYDNYENGVDSTRTTVIAVIAVVVAIKIAILIWICHRRSQLQAERRARGYQHNLIITETPPPYVQAEDPIDLGNRNKPAAVDPPQYEEATAPIPQVHYA